MTKIKMILMLLCLGLVMSSCAAKKESVLRQEATSVSAYNLVTETESEATDASECESEKGNKIEDSDDIVCESVETSEIEGPDTEEEELLLLGKILDLAPYIENDGCVRANTTDKDLSWMDVNGTRFTLGMTYDEVLSLGFMPDDEEFMNREPSALAVWDTFSNSEGDTVRLGFAVSYEGAKEHATVKNGGFLYLIRPNGAFEVAGISDNSTPAKVVACLGAPYRIGGGSYNDFLDAKLEYLNNYSNNKFLTIRFNLETEEIVSVTLEGYVE